MSPRKERRAAERGRLAFVFDLFFPLLRVAFTRARSAWLGLGIVLGLGVLVLGLATYGFVEISASVVEGETQRFDERVLRWIATYHTPLAERAMVEVTMLGTWIVVFAVAGIAGVFLFLSHHRFSALLLFVATAGSLVFNNILKVGFARPRPQVFEWGTHVVSYSFPSGHATSAAAVYGTVAYLAARLQKRAWARVLTLAIFGLIILVICFSRLYLGVHYPSDVAAGAVFGLGWAAFCMLTLEGVQRFAKRNAKQLILDEDEPPSAVEAQGRHRGARRPASSHA